MTDSHAKHLDDVINQRRIDLGLTWRDLAAEAGISYETLRAARKGIGTPDVFTKRGIEDALGWQHGSFDAVNDGGEPRRALEEAEQPAAPAAEARLRQPGLPPGIPRSELPPWAQQMYERLDLISDDEVDLIVGFLSSTSRKRPPSTAAARRADRRAL